MQVQIYFNGRDSAVVFENVIDTKVDSGMYGVCIIENGKRKAYLFPITTIDSVEEITDLGKGE